jgi:hypothetical protein
MITVILKRMSMIKVKMMCEEDVDESENDLKEENNVKNR